MNLPSFLTPLAVTGTAASATLPLFFINLDRSPQRRAKFLADNALPGLGIIRMPAIDGGTLDRSALVSGGTIAADLAQANNVIGCTLSHIRCWLTVIKMGRPAVVCEDETVLRRDFAEVHHSLSEEVAASDIVFWSVNHDMHFVYDVPGLGACTTIFDKYHLASDDEIELFQDSCIPTRLFRLRRIFGTACYTITPAGARRLLQRLLPLRNGSVKFGFQSGMGHNSHYEFVSVGIDIDIGLIHVNDLMARVAMPPIAFSRHAVQESTIGTGHWKDRLISQTG